MPFFSISTPPLLNLLFPSVDAHLHSDETLQVSLSIPRLLLHSTLITDLTCEDPRKVPSLSHKLAMEVEERQCM